MTERGRQRTKKKSSSGLQEEEKEDKKKSAGELQFIVPNEQSLVTFLLLLLKLQVNMLTWAERIKSSGISVL